METHRLYHQWHYGWGLCGLGELSHILTIPNFRHEIPICPIGLNTDSLIVGPFGSPDVQMLFWGRKGLSTSRGKLNTVGRFFKSGASIVNLAADHIMFPNQPTDQLAAWPPCFETLAIVHQPYIPAPIKAGTTVHSFSRNRIATPTPRAMKSL